MPRAPILFPTVIAGLLLAAAPALGQTTAPSRAAGLRTLSWPGKVERPVVASPQAVTAQPAPQPAARVPAPTATTAIAYPPAPSAYGLTPASAWLRPAPTAAPAAPTPWSAPVPYAASAPEPAPAPRTTPPPLPMPLPMPAREPAEVATLAPAPETPVPAAADPMAPRRDAAIFRLQPAAPAPAAPSPAPTAQGPVLAAPATQGARYYSVHRAAGRQPDPVPLPQPFFLDAAPVDLAEPPAQPTIIRGADGRARSALVDEPELP